MPLESVAPTLANAGALVVLAVALFVIAVTLRRDVNGGLAARVAALEQSDRRNVARIHQLETAMRDNGVPVPPWPEEATKESAAA